ncbi:ATP phosphoribosyltransferase regulatory subunit [Caldibacillus lycopersici]|uniref:ATP phosphoribosyltransferase regulatory subunit n=1 Tax=Perspicuibacillus lycopersici TaxID=1325689 RepID=A0AAE3LMP1_9BACI|nr:ATP phosphoribosyltransferase regulatory subunit [Perspicuibacillus lycopersici]MCU9613795.1 ATP phosphoribosyltransferase regulatory subunit [Perspicuibacillus lycopersici]
MQLLSQIVPEGVTDLLANDFDRKEQLTVKIKQLFRENQFKQIQTPIFEYYDLFSEMKGTIEKDRMIKLIDTDGKILVLRPDATIPIARMVATNYKDAAPIQKFSYVTSIFRMNDDPQNVQSREFTQAGVELFGKAGIEADVEVISLAIESLKQVGVKAFTIDIGQANFYKALMEPIDLPMEEMAVIEKLIEKKNFAELTAAIGNLPIGMEYKQALQTIPTLCGEPKRVLEQAWNIAVNNEMKAEISQLKEVYGHLVALGYESYLSLDLGLINHLNYYTSIIFQGYIPGFGKPVILGGRYDSLTKQFGYDTKATGFAIYIDDLMLALHNIG